MTLTNDKVKGNLCKELKLALKNAALEIPLGDYISSEATLTLCNVIEAIFIHGLKDPFFVKGSRYAKYPEPNFWPFLYKYTHKSIKIQIDSLSQIKTDIGKARAWIRIVLNENSMEHYLRLFSRDPDGFSFFYHKHAFLRDFENYNVMTGYLKGIANVTIDAPMNSTFLNAWTPTPLILAGLIAGKPARLEQLSLRNRLDFFVEDGEVEEVGECALDLVDIEQGTGMPSASRRASKNVVLYLAEDDELSSVYSHPSMIEHGVERAPAFFYSSTPEKNGFLSSGIPETSGFTDETYQVNVRRRKHRLRNISKSSSEDGSRSRSGSTSNAAGAVRQKLKVARDDEVFISEGIVTELVGCVNIAGAALVLPSEIAGVGSNSANVPMDDSRGICIGDGPIRRSPGNQPAPTSTSVCEDSCDSGVAEVSVCQLECAVPGTSSKLCCHMGDDDLVVTHETATSCADYSSGSSNMKTERRDTNDSILSLQDELLLVGSPSTGNSLVGKGWAYRSPQPQQDWEQASGQSSSLRTNSSHNFDSMIRNVITGYEDNELETSVRSRLDSENFSETFNDDGFSGIEIGTASVRENADEGSFIATATFLSSSEKNASNRKRVTDHDAVMVDEEEMNGQDEFGISRDLIPLLTNIPREIGLADQDFRCPSCSKSIGPTFSPYRICGLDGKYYCTNCCRKCDQSVIPSRLVHNWDFKLRPVSRANLSFLRAVEDRPIIRLDKVNATIYDHCLTMKKVLGLREKLALASMYLLSCRQSVAEDLRLRLWPKEYLYNDIHLYSFSDFQCALSGQLESHLNSIIRYAVNHIFHCKLCVQKGFLCEICSSREVIYPFQVETTVRCTACFSVYHKQCYEKERCRKCARRERYAERVSTLVCVTVCKSIHRAADACLPSIESFFAEYASTSFSK